jgi:hypothetical protein
MTQGAGWLFADLLLVVVLIVLGSQWNSPAGRGDEADEPGPSTSAPAAVATTPAAQPGLDPDSEEFDVSLDAVALVAGKASAVRALRKRVEKGIEKYPGRTAALVIVWGTAGSCRTCPVTDQASRTYAHAVATRLTGVAPGFFPPYDEDIIRSYRNTSSDRDSGTATIELFFLRT